MSLLLAFALAVLAAASDHQPRTRLEPGAVFSDCSGCPEMVVVPPGTFTMGATAAPESRDKDEFPAHRVTIAQPFAVGKYEVTRAQFAAFVAETGHVAASNCSVWTGTRAERVATATWRSSGIEQTDAHPVICVSFDDAVAYLAWLSKRSGRPYRLLSEAEWEYAARAGATTDYAFGDNPDEQCRHGNIADDTAKAAGGLPTWTYANCRDGVGIGTAPVGAYAPNRFGLHDMLGNIWEWVEDCYHDSYVGAPADGSAWTSGNCTLRVDRGGAYYNNRGSNRVSERASYPPANASGNFGFRVARGLP